MYQNVQSGHVSPNIDVSRRFFFYYEYFSHIGGKAGPTFYEYAKVIYERVTFLHCRTKRTKQVFMFKGSIIPCAICDTTIPDSQEPHHNAHLGSKFGVFTSRL